MPILPTGRAQPMRVLVTTNAAIGHFLPMAATIAELSAGGHEVRVGCPESFAPFVRDAGFEAIPCEEADVAIPPPPPPPAEDHESRLMWAVTQSWPHDCRSWLDSLLAHATKWRPDLVVVEPVEHAGRVVAAALGVPLAQHGWGFALPGAYDHFAATGIMDLYRDLGTTPPSADMVSELGPSIEADDATGPARYRYQAFPVRGSEPIPERTDKPRVLVTLGTYRNPQARSVIQIAVDAALGAAEVIAVLGNPDRGSAHELPAGVMAFDWVDMREAVSTSDLVVHHGGAGTSWTALSGGKPAVVLPQGGDQFRNADLLEAAGVALVCPSAEPSLVTAAIRRGLHDSGLATSATRIATQNAALPSVAELAGDIATLALTGELVHQS